MTVPESWPFPGPDTDVPVPTPPHIITSCTVCHRELHSDREPIFPGVTPWTYRCKAHKVKGVQRS